MTEKQAPSLWHRSLTHYRLPDGTIVRVWNGAALYYAWRAQQKAKERDGKDVHS